MTDAIKSKKPVPHEAAKPPDTHPETNPLEQKIPPQHNTTEPYGTSDPDATRKTEG